jgi:hypothetical protein
MDRSKQLAFPIHPTNTSSVCIELAGGIRICCIGRKLKRCRYGLELHVAMPAFVRTLTEPSIFASARIEWLSCGSRITALGSSPRPTASRSRRKRRWINDDATIARPEILLAEAIRPCPIQPPTQAARALRPGEDPDPYRDFSRGTGSSNPSPSSGESANFRFLALAESRSDDRGWPAMTTASGAARACLDVS